MNTRRCKHVWLRYAASVDDSGTVLSWSGNLLVALLVVLGSGCEGDTGSSSMPTFTPQPTRTATPTFTPTATPSPTPTNTYVSPTPGGPTFRISGCVVHFSGCGGSQEFGVVTLSPLGRTANVDLGTFFFDDVPAGRYVLTYSPRCNPAGCTGEVQVEIADGDTSAGFYRTPGPYP